VKNRDGWLTFGRDFESVSRSNRANAFAGLLCCNCVEWKNRPEFVYN